MAEAKYKQIDGKQYTVAPLPARRGIRLFVKWGAMLGSSMGKLGDPKIAKADTNSAVFSSLLADLFSHLDDGPLDVALDELMATVSENDVPYTPERYNVEFAGNLVGLCKVVAFALEAQFGDFWKAFAAMGGDKPVKATKSKAAPDTSPEKSK